MFQSFSRSFHLALSSWRVLWQDKQLVLFPILSGLASTLVVVSFLLPTIALVNAGGLADPETGQVYWYAYVLGFAFYFVSYFVVIFFNAALIFCALMRFRGEQPTLAAGLAAAGSRLPAILSWAFVSATVGVLLQVIESTSDKVGQIVSNVLGLAWTMLTYFVVPVLVVDNVGPIDAVKRSVGLLRKSWGEGLVGNAGLGLFTLLLMLPAFLLIAGGVYLLGATEAPWMVGVSVASLGLIAFLLAAAVASALGTVFQAALYRYAVGQEVPAGFQRIDLEGAFRPAKAAA